MPSRAEPSGAQPPVKVPGPVAPPLRVGLVGLGQRLHIEAYHARAQSRRSTAAFVDAVLGRADHWRLDAEAAREVLGLALMLEQFARTRSRVISPPG